MTRPPGDKRRLGLIQRLRTDWRKGHAAEGDPRGARTEDENRERERDALDANDRIRAERPDDLETRRRADQLEREIRRDRRSEGA